MLQTSCQLCKEIIVFTTSGKPAEFWTMIYISECSPTQIKNPEHHFKYHNKYLPKYIPKAEYLDKS